MQRRTLGKSSLSVSALGLGGMSFSGAYGPGQDPESIALIHRALDLGINFIDSSDMYGWGHNEELLAQALRGRWGAVVLATKFGQVRRESGPNLLNGTVHGPGDVPEGDRRRAHPCFQDANLVKNVELVRRVEAVARERGCTPGQLVLAWLLAQGPDVVPIPGTKRRSRLEENLGALDVTFSGDDVKQLADAVPAGAAAGPRYPEPQMKAVYL